MALLQTRALGVTLVDRLVLAILLGALLRSAWALPEQLHPGISFAATPLLEVAIVLLGASVDLPLLLRAGPTLAVGIIALVVVALVLGYLIGRALRLPPRLAALMAAGNAICGNSAIAALAPVIGATTAEVTRAIAFTAVLGISVVLGLPFLIAPMGLSDYQFGVLAGISVYAVPQVLAATLPVSALAAQVGTLVKLVRVLMLGPVIVVVSFVRNRLDRAGATVSGGSDVPATERRDATHPFPWFLVGFLIVATLRTVGVVTEPVARQLAGLSGWLTLIAMAGLGLGVDMRQLRQAGIRVSLAAGLSMLGLVGLGVGLLSVLSIE